MCMCGGARWKGVLVSKVGVVYKCIEQEHTHVVQRRRARRKGDGEVNDFDALLISTENGPEHDFRLDTTPPKARQHGTGCLTNLSAVSLAIREALAGLVLACCHPVRS